MVLSSSPAAEGQAGELAWLTELRRWLKLGREGVLVMIRAAQSTQLRPLTRVLDAIEPEWVLVSRASDLVELERGALALLLVRESELDWLNLNRPIFSQRSLRVILWAEQPLSAQLKFASPDLHDWISHFVTCPPGVPQFAVEGLQVASRWWPGAAWYGPGLELALAKLGIAVETLRPDAAFADLVEVLAADPNRAIRWEGVDTLSNSWRVRWALAEARHRGFCVLDQPRVSAPGWFPVSSLQLSLDDAEQLSGKPLGAAIEAELELEAIVPGEPTEVHELGLLLRPGPDLRAKHESPEVVRWRRELVRAMRRDPECSWSLAELALFASLERDRVRWPTWRAPYKLRHVVEHELRHARASDRSTSLAFPAAYLRDRELVSRWAGSEDPDVYGQLELAEAIWDDDQGPLAVDAPTPEMVLEAAELIGWEMPLIPQAVARASLALLDKPQELRPFVEDLLEPAQNYLGRLDPAMLDLRLLAAIATALGGDPWRARDDIEDAIDSLAELSSRGLQPAMFDSMGPVYAAILALCGGYSQATAILQDRVDGDDRVRPLYLALLMATGRSEESRAEEPRESHGPGSSPEARARALLLAELRERGAVPNPNSNDY